MYWEMKRLDLESAALAVLEPQIEVEAIYNQAILHWRTRRGSTLLPTRSLHGWMMRLG
jgi:hypothetical protein